MAEKSDSTICAQQNEVGEDEVELANSPKREHYCCYLNGLPHELVRRQAGVRQPARHQLPHHHGEAVNIRFFVVPVDRTASTPQDIISNRVVGDKSITQKTNATQEVHERPMAMLGDLHAAHPVLQVKY